MIGDTKVREEAGQGLSRIHPVETNPHPDPLPFPRGEGNLRWHRGRVTEQGSETRAFSLSSPRSERGEDQGEGRFRLHTYDLGVTKAEFPMRREVRTVKRPDRRRVAQAERRSPSR